MTPSLTSWAGDVLRRGLAPAGPTIDPARIKVEFRGDGCFVSALGSTALERLRDATVDIVARTLNYPESALEFVRPFQDVMNYEGQGDLEARLKQTSLLVEKALDVRASVAGALSALVAWAIGDRT